ncbi:hypothetical protein ACLB2K_049204 [Fragaria x ananassa]
MAEIQPPEINGGQFTTEAAAAAAVGAKRQRRPSVRLGEIGGDQPYDSNPRRAAKQWRLPPVEHQQHRKESSKSSKTRPLVNLSSGGEFDETLEREEREGNLDSVAIGSWKVKETKKRASTGTKRVRSNWVPAKIDEGGGEDGEDGYREFGPEESESPMKEQNPIHSSENLPYHGSRRAIRTRVLEHDGVELSGPSENNDGREWNGRGTSNGNEGRVRCGEDGVRVWLNGLGLSRYAPVFEIHEVDDEVLPMLTLEDLKDMGINAVGSRRKMYCAIQKLGKGYPLMAMVRTLFSFGPRTE